MLQAIFADPDTKKTADEETAINAHVKDGNTRMNLGAPNTCTLSWQWDLCDSMVAFAASLSDVLVCDHTLEGGKGQ